MAASPLSIPRPAAPKVGDAGPPAEASSPAEAFPIGSVVGGRYVLKRELGRGGAASVFAAEHAIVKRSVALKLPHTDPDLREVLSARLRRETQALARVRHPVIVDVIDAGESDGMPFLAMQLIEGRTLSGLVAARGRLEADEVVKIGVHLGSGLAAVHAAGILHRDVKPANVIVTRDPRIQLRLFDFGVAKLAGATEAVDRKLTQNGAILGTIEYMPEALLSQPTNDHRADIYALGVTLYECLTGAVPFEGNLGQILVRLTTSEATPLTDVRPDLPRPLVDIVHRCLRREPGERFESMADLTTALAACATRKLETIDVLGGAARTRAAPPPLPSPADPRASAQPQPSPPSAPKPEIRRLLPRAPYVTMASVLRDGQSPIDAKIEDISEGGVLVVAAEQCTPGATLRLRFALPISGRIAEVSSVVRWSRTTRGTRATGFEFQGMPAPAVAEIRQYVTLMGGS